MGARILIIGGPCTGKTTLRKLLENKISSSGCSMDDLYWEAGWVRPKKEIYIGRLKNYIRGEEWLLDGNFFDTLPMRVNFCSHIIFLNYPTYITVFRFIKRSFYRHFVEAKKPQKKLINKSSWNTIFYTLKGISFFIRKVIFFRIRFTKKISLILDKASKEGKYIIKIEHPKNINFNELIKSLSDTPINPDIHSY